jgi:erythromycin esterase-like protein
VKVVKNDIRNTLRRTKESRRVTDRRVAPYAFGSEEWVENIKANYYVWPKTDRRQACRRSEDRRAFDRRQRQLNDQQRSEQKFSKILLTHEELKLIEELYKNDLD